ncbi:MAG: ParB N-terminal domain-containing protein [Actinomycetales bacterium]|nr:ParB N-terminal domain-containing protein [Actinomycetales bacterium]
MSSAGNLVPRQSVDSIRIPDRHRRDLGDIDALAASIQEFGLFQPIVITTAGELVLGQRVLAAVKQLGWRDVPVWVVPSITDRLSLLRAIEADHRLAKQRDPVELAGLYAEMKTLYAEYARARQEASRFGRTGAGDSPAPLRSNAAAAIAVTGRDSHQAHERVLKVLAFVEDPTVPERLRAEAEHAIAAMRRTGSVNAPYADVVTAQARDRLEEVLGDAPPERAEAARRAIRQLEAAPTAVARISRAHATLAALEVEGGWADIDPAFRGQSALRRLRGGLQRAERWWEGIDPADLDAELPEELAAGLVGYHASLTEFLRTLELLTAGAGAST